jgi:hypothetical protein
MTEPHAQPHIQPHSERGPIETATADLLDWLGRAAGQPARLAAPGDSADEGLALWPLELRTLRQTRGVSRREPYRFGVRYLVTATGPNPLRLLDRVLAAAVAAGEPEILLAAGDPALWQAFAAAPRPALLVDVPAQLAYTPQTAPPVLHPLRIKHIARRTLTGLVVGPGDEPLAAMRVEVAGTPYATHTDAQGRFTVAGVPEAAEVRLRLVGRGQTLTAVVDPAEADLVIHCELPTR